MTDRRRDPAAIHPLGHALCSPPESDAMWTLIGFVLLLWLAGLLTSVTFGGWLHLLLLLALGLVVSSFFGRKSRRRTSYR
ncbi:MAG TPA: hypothetical protein VMT00_01090 [Thermoanaerobaculia bacterium]|nr:hypothetical protein [Thermoanaerobaculia bacterium]